MGLITLSEFKLGLGVDTSDTSHDAQYTQAIENASQIVRAYTDRDFGSEQEDNQVREFEYESPSGIVDIDDCAVVNSVTIVEGLSSRLLDDTEWSAQPHRGPVYYWLRFTFRYLPESPAMGFKRNLDKRDYYPLPAILQVDADWGWPVVPADVKQAVIWIAAAVKDNPAAFISETIEGYSRTISNQVISDPLPLRARQILDHYVRVDL